MRYERYLSRDCLDLLLPGGALAPLVAATQMPWRQGLFLDLQLRRFDTVMLYAGLTRPLRAQRLKSGRGAVRFSADKFYEKQSPGMSWGERVDPLMSAAQIPADLETYLHSVEVPPSALAKEGRAQNSLSRCYGANRRSADEWVAIDREVVISYANRDQRARIWGPVRNWAKDVFRTLQERDSTRFGSNLAHKAVGQELDLLLWDPVAECFLVTEVKDGSGASGVYLSPVQVAAYTAIWRTFASREPAAAIEGICRLVEQKVALGLIAADVKLPDRVDPEMFQPLVVVQDPRSESDQC